MKNANHKVTGILLAGGMSTRMGREKGSMRIGKRLMFEYPLLALESICDEIIISGSKALPGNYSYPVIPDEIYGIGPMGGIYTCLDQSRNDLNLVISYDMPLVNESILRYLLEHSGSRDMVAPALQGGKPEPLCSLYRKKVKTKFRELIEEQDYAVHRVIPRVNSLILHIEPTMPFYEPGLFLNINSINDLNNLPEDFS